MWMLLKRCLLIILQVYSQDGPPLPYPSQGISRHEVIRIRTYVISGYVVLVFEGLIISHVVATDDSKMDWADVLRVLWLFLAWFSMSKISMCRACRAYS